MGIRSTYFGAQMTNSLGAASVVRPREYTKVLLQDNYVDATWSPMDVLKW